MVPQLRRSCYDCTAPDSLHVAFGLRERLDLYVTYQSFILLV
jgi:hypothetical protein